MEAHANIQKEIRIHSLQVGQPQTVTGEKGNWTSAIFRKPVFDPVFLAMRGLDGDQVADKKHHGSPEQAVSCHHLEHYAFWNAHYQLENTGRLLEPGMLGENWTLSGSTEADFCVGDLFRAGEAVVRVTYPRYPCWKQERRTGLPGFLEKVKEDRRTGFYFQVIEPGMVQAGNELILEERPNPGFSIQLLNELIHKPVDLALAEKFLGLAELPAGWKEKLRKLMDKHVMENK